MLDKIFVSAKVKPIVIMSNKHVIISNKHGIYELPHELLNHLAPEEISRRSQNFREL